MTARFTIGEHCRVFTEDHRPVQPGSGIPGFIVRSGPIPVGYYKDPEKSAKTFPVIDGVRYSVPGDWCTVEVDGTLTLLGLGSVCINSGGEKIYPEEIEEALKTHPTVEDALVVGVPDERWGLAVTGVVVPTDGAAFDEGALREYVKSLLAPYKAPKRILIAEGALARAERQGRLQRHRRLRAACTAGRLTRQTAPLREESPAEMRNPFLIGARIYLRGLDDEDLKGNYLSWFNDADVCTHNSHHFFPYTQERGRQYLGNVNTSSTALVLAIVVKDHDIHIGNLSLQGIHTINQNAEFAIILGEREYWGKGYANEASHVLFKHGFLIELNLHRIYCGTAADNIPMQKLAISLGMMEEGRRREAFFKHGRYHVS